MTTPPITPAQAMALLTAGGTDRVTLSGWTVQMDRYHCTSAPVISPPGVTPGEEDTYICSGEYGDPIDATTYWVFM